jgi:hypothetical protein
LVERMASDYRGSGKTNSFVCNPTSILVPSPDTGSHAVRREGMTTGE